MPTATQTNQPMRLTTPLGPDVLLFAGMSGHEAISQLFNFDIDTLAETGRNVEFDKILGQPITVEMKLSNGKPRHFNGICVRITEGDPSADFTNFQLRVVPRLWLLTQRSHSRIFQHLSVPDILKQVLDGLDVAFEIQGTFQPRDYCVQYRETDFHFASRLMEEEGIYYFFKHTATGHKLVLANTPQSHSPMPEISSVLFEKTDGGFLREDRVHVWSKSQEVRSGKYVLFDHSFELPHKHLEAEKFIQESVQVGRVNHKLNAGPNRGLELFDFPGEYAERFDGVDKGGGEQPAELQKLFVDNIRTAGIRMEEEAVHSLTIQGAGDCRQFVSGHRFTLGRHGKGDGDYVIVGLEHSAYMGDYRSNGSSAEYTNSFTCIPVGLPFRPPRTTPKPVIPGTQTAVVVGPKGQEIFTDKFGRVKVQFHWDRDGKNDADSSCWVRVAQPWAGKRWGTSFSPRIGQEVIVAFGEGDPDRPIIVGSVYNADQMAPYLGNGLDSKHTNDNKVSGIKTNTTPGGQGFNELRFDDTKGKEQVFIHGEKDQDLRIKNDRRELILHDTHLIVGGEKDGKKVGDQRELVHQNRHQSIHGNHTEHIHGNVEYMVGHGGASGGGNADIVIEKDKKELIEKNNHLHVKASQMVAVGGTQSVTVHKDRKEEVKGALGLKIGKDLQEKVGGGHSLNVAGSQNIMVKSQAVDAQQSIYINAGTTLILEAGTQISLKVGGNFIDISSAGISIVGAPMVNINSGGAAGSGESPITIDPQPPDAPQDAKQAKPTEPDLADDSKSGLKSAP